MAKLLIIDDDIELAELFQEYLCQEGFEVDVIYEGIKGLRAALSGQYDLVILDMMLPDIKGTDILVQLRQQSLIPVLMFTAKGDDVDRIIGLESGADDYVPKPCSPRELTARIRAILRRTDHNINQDGINAGPLQLWSEKRKATWFGEPIDLTSTEFNLLETLANNAGQVVSKNELSEYGLGRPLAKFDRSIDVHVSSIRHKLGQQPDGQSYIQTIRGKGYQFVKE